MSNIKLKYFYVLFTDIHTEAVQAALAKHKEEKMALPMPTKRRSTYVPSPIETRTPPGRPERGTDWKWRSQRWITHPLLFFCLDSSSGSEDETSVPRHSSVVIPPPQVNPNLQSPDAWINRTVQGSSTSSSASSTLSHGEAKLQLHSQPPPQPQPQYKPQYQPLYQPHHQPQYQPQNQQQEHTAAVTNMLAQTRIGEHLLHLFLSFFDWNIGGRHHCFYKTCAKMTLLNIIILYNYTIPTSSDCC